jgi:5'-3' exonuclease
MLLDGDQFLHRACAAVERDVKWDDENHVLVSNEVEAWEVVEGSVKKTLEHFGHEEHVLCLSDTGTQDFRKDLVDPTYKAHRQGTRKPLCFADLKQKMLRELKCRSVPGLEADDVMGILATKPGDHERIIVSRDKDMRTIPTKVWTGDKFYNVSEVEADYFHLYQTLVGDTSDGYKGCPGIGPKKAEKLLQDAIDANSHLYDAHCAWTAVVAAYVKAGLTEADALRQARLARILRWSDWDAENKRPILWTPST